MCVCVNVFVCVTTYEYVCECGSVHVWSKWYECVCVYGSVVIMYVYANMTAYMIVCVNFIFFTFCVHFPKCFYDEHVFLSD